MTIETLFSWWQFVAIAGLNLFGFVRSTILRSQGFRVVALDHKQPISKRLRDLLVGVFLLLWFYESAIDAFSVSFQLLPSVLYVILVDQIWLQAVGAVLMAVGLLLYVLAIRSFGVSWRIGIDSRTFGPLVTEGIFAWTRNPIYVALDLCAIGTFLIHGRLVFLVLALGVVVLLHDQIRIEESFLTKTYGQAYQEYCNSIGRYVTWPFKR